MGDGVPAAEATSPSEGLAVPIFVGGFFVLLFSIMFCNCAMEKRRKQRDARRAKDELMGVIDGGGGGGGTSTSANRKDQNQQPSNHYNNGVNKELDDPVVIDMAHVCEFFTQSRWVPIGLFYFLFIYLFIFLAL